MSGIQQRRSEPTLASEPEDLPTAYGGRSDIEPREPGQSLGRVPDPDDADVDEAGDPIHREADARRAMGGQRAGVDTSGTTAQPERS